MAFKDRVDFTDGVKVGLAGYAPPKHPCPKCEAETKEHHPVIDDAGVLVKKRRICSKPSCRHVIDIELD